MSRLASVPPTRDELLDALALTVLTCLGLIGFKSAYGGTAYLIVGMIAFAFGLVLAHVTVRLRQPLLLVAIVTVVAACLLSAGVAFRTSATGGFVPTLTTLRELFSAVVHGWKELLTTVQPVGSAGDLLAIPYLLGLLAAVVGYSAARRSRYPGLALFAPAAVVALSILFGAPTPAAEFLQGAAFAGVGLGWMAVRQARRPTIGVRSRSRLMRPLTALAMLAVAVGGASVVGPHLPLAQAQERVVLHAQPPFDASAYPSPLAGYRKFTKASPYSLADATLFTVHGLAANSIVRIATMDAYDGTVWGVSNAAGAGTSIAGFAKVGNTLPGGSSGARSVRVDIGPGYRDVWLPTTGNVSGISFAGPDAKVMADQLRYNLATGTGVITGGLRSGDVVILAERPVSMPSTTELSGATPYGAPDLPPSSTAFVQATAAKWAGSATTPVQQALAIAAYLHANGRYSDGADTSGSLPGHGIARIGEFLQSQGQKQIVGDDEQYGAAMALMANAVGVPARVVLEATVPASGVVTGSMISVGVELRLAGFGWVDLHEETFTPSRDNAPLPQTVPPPPKNVPPVVPPPAKALPPVDLGSTRLSDSLATQRNAARPTAAGFQIPGIVITAIRWAGPPLLVVAAAVLSVLGLKQRRRRRRRSRGAPATRVAAGWRELIDVARDHGLTVNRWHTRREQARALGALPSPMCAALAGPADTVTFGPEPPNEAAVAHYWHQVDEAKRALAASVGWRARWKAALSLRSLRAVHAEGKSA